MQNPATAIDADEYVSGATYWVHAELKAAAGPGLLSL